MSRSVPESSVLPLAPLPPNAPLYVKVHTVLFRATHGTLGMRAGRWRFLLLTTTGRKSGRRYVVPLAYFLDDTTPFVVASNYGHDFHPAWYLNLCVNPAVEVELGRERHRAIAEVADPQTRARLWADVVRQAPHFGRYQQGTTREIPLVLLHLTP